jgi:hypothetical protein
MPLEQYQSCQRLAACEVGFNGCAGDRLEERDPGRNRDVQALNVAPSSV